MCWQVRWASNLEHVGNRCQPGLFGVDGSRMVFEFDPGCGAVPENGAWPQHDAAHRKRVDGLGLQPPGTCWNRVGSQNGFAQQAERAERSNHDPRQVEAGHVLYGRAATGNDLAIVGHVPDLQRRFSQSATAEHVHAVLADSKCAAHSPASFRKTGALAFLGQRCMKFFDGGATAHRDRHFVGHIIDNAGWGLE